MHVRVYNYTFGGSYGLDGGRQEREMFLTCVYVLLAHTPTYVHVFFNVCACVIVTFLVCTTVSLCVIGVYTYMYMVSIQRGLPWVSTVYMHGL